MNGFKRRKLLGLAAGAVVMGTALPRARATGGWSRLNQEVGAQAVSAPHNAAEVSADAAEPLLALAAAWVDRLRQRGQTHLFYPVSRLQREFLLGYGRTCAMADVLAQRGEWRIGFSSDGTRYARIHPKVRA